MKKLLIGVGSMFIVLLSSNIASAKYYSGTFMALSKPNSNAVYLYCISSNSYCGYTYEKNTVKMFKSAAGDEYKFLSAVNDDDNNNEETFIGEAIKVTDNNTTL